MPVKIRLQRHGKKGKPFYWVVAADARAKRDGRYLEKLGIYNPNTNPATVEIDIDSAVSWLEKGAQPTDTARTLLSYRGALLKHHLNGGVRKGALTQEEADKKLAAWLEEKVAKIDAKKDGISKGKAEAYAKRIEDEKAAGEKRLAQAAAAEAEAVEADASEEQATEEAAAEAVENTTEEVAVEETVAETEAPAEDAVAETEAPVEEAVAETEAPAEEPVAETTDSTEENTEEAASEEKEG
jgi:small subunit ribosomal protein S16